MGLYKGHSIIVAITEEISNVFGTFYSSFKRNRSILTFLLCTDALASLLLRGTRVTSPIIMDDYNIYESESHFDWNKFIFQKMETNSIHLFVKFRKALKN